MLAGSSTIRTTVASTRIAVASAMPIILISTSGSAANPANTATMMAAALVTTLAVEPSPPSTARCASRPRVHSSRMRDMMNTS